MLKRGAQVRADLSFPTNRKLVGVGQLFSTRSGLRAGMVQSFPLSGPPLQNMALLKWSETSLRPVARLSELAICFRTCFSSARQGYTPDIEPPRSTLKHRASGKTVVVCPLFQSKEIQSPASVESTSIKLVMDTKMQYTSKTRTIVTRQTSRVNVLNFGVPSRPGHLDPASPKGASRKVCNFEAETLTYISSTLRNH